MTPAVDQLPNDIKTLKEIIIQGFTHRDQEIALLKEQLRLLQSMIFGRKSEKSQPEGNGQQLLLNFGDASLAQEIALEVKSSEPVIVVQEHARKRGRKPIPEEFPRVQKIIDIPEADKVCACGCTKARIGQETSEQLEYVPSKWLVIENIRPKYACRHCEGTESEGPTVAIAPVPEQIIPKSFATASLLAYIIVSKFVDALPFYRLSKMFSRNGVELSRGTMCNWAIKVAALLKPVTDIFKAMIMESPIIHADETIFQVLKEVGRKASNKSYMWVFRSGGCEKPTILFHYNHSRAGKIAQNIIAGYKGYIQTDGYPGYNFIERNSDQIHIACWAHVRRKFFEAVKAAGKDVEPGIAHEAINIIKDLYRIEKESKDFDPDQRCELRKAESRPILERFKICLDKWNLAVASGNLTGRAVKYALNQWDALIRYVEDGRLQIDNNRVENAIRPFAVGRKNWLFADSVEGANASATIYSILETAKANGLEPYWYMRILLEKLPNLKTREDFLLYIPQNIDKQLIEELQKQHLGLNSRA